MARFRCQQLPGGNTLSLTEKQGDSCFCCGVEITLLRIAGRYRYNTITPIPGYKILLAPDRQASTIGSLLRKLTLVGIEDGHQTYCGPPGMLSGYLSGCYDSSPCPGLLGELPLLRPAPLSAAVAVRKKSNEWRARPELGAASYWPRVIT